MRLKNPIDLLHECRRKGIELFLEEDRLRVKVEKERKVDPQLLDEIRASKDAIIALLRNTIPAGREEYPESERFIPSNKGGLQIPASFSQERLWFIHQMEGSAPYHISTVLKMRGVLDKEALEYAMRTIVQRHEALRTVIEEREGTVYQRVLDGNGWELGLIDGSGFARNEPVLRKTIEQQVKAPFDLSRDYMLRVVLTGLGPREYILAVTMHHIASDAWSMSILVDEFVRLYTAHHAGRQIELPRLPIQYADYSMWQRAYLRGELLDRKMEYWRQRLQDIPSLDLPTDHLRPEVPGSQGARICFHIGKELTAELHRLGRREGATLFMVLLSAYKVLLYRYSGQEDICVGIPIAGREQHQVEGLIGLFVNTLALRSDLRGNPGFTDLLQQVKEAALGAYENQDVPLEKVVEALLKGRGMSRRSLFQVMFELQNDHRPGVTGGGMAELEISTENLATDTSKCDLFFSMTEGKDGLQGIIEYSTDLFEEDTIRRMAGHFEILLRSIAAKPDGAIGALPMLTAIEKEKLAGYGGGEGENSDPEEHFSVVGQVFGSIRLNRDATAISYRGKDISYEEMGEVINGFCWYFTRRLGLARGMRVVVLIDRSHWIPLTLLALWKSGLVYVPVDVDYPEFRIRHILDEIKPALVVTEKRFLAFVDGLGYLGVEVSSMENKKEENIEEAGVRGEDEAYIIYTSGSSGTPRGVVVTHANIDHFAGHVCSAHCAQKVVTPFIASHAFDISFFQLLLPFLSGGKCLIVDKGQLENMDELAALLKGVTMIDTVPGLYKVLLDHLDAGEPEGGFDHVQQLFIGGDRIGEGLLYRLSQRFRHAGITVTYGPTEGTVFCTETTYAPGSVSMETTGTIIGKPIDGVSICILNDHQELMPPGLDGEIYIGGRGVAREYIHQPGPSSDRFIENPFPGKGRLYRSGDMGRWLEGGLIEFRGRRDSQVKIRGFRIELGEIEHTLQQHEQIEQAIVRAVPAADQSKVIAAYYVPKAKVQVWPSISEYLGYNDIAYFAMNNDEMRAGSYRKAIWAAVRDKVVVDVGTGPEAILAQHCISAGAVKVYAIEILDEVYQKAKDRIRQLGLEDRIIVLHGDIMEIELPEKVDYCVCALVGNLGSSDGCIPIMNSAKKFLKDPAAMIPYRSETWIAAVNIPGKELNFSFTPTGLYYIDTIFARSLHRFDLRIALQNVTHRHLISTKGIFESLDITGHLQENSVHEIVLDITSDAEMSGFVAWLNLYTAPDIVDDVFENQNSFLPIYFPVFDEPVNVRKGDRICATITRKIGKGNIYPDFYIQGVLTGRDGETAFSYASERLPHNFCNSGFYRKLFPGGQPQSGQPLSEAELQKFLAARLPQYMMPSAIIKIENIPLTANGKINLNALPGMAGATEPTGMRIAPRNETEEMLAGIWKELLGAERIGVRDNFFELGGHSLVAMRLANAIKKKFSIEIPIRMIFKLKDIESMARYIRTSPDSMEIKAPVEQGRIEPGVLRKYEYAGEYYYPVTPTQAYWANEDMDTAYKEKESSHGVKNFKYRITGNFDPEICRKAIAFVVGRHESLRATFHKLDGKYWMKVDDPLSGKFDMEYVDAEGPESGNSRTAERLINLEDRSISLKDGPLFLSRIIRIKDGEYILSMKIHHIISDTWSTEVMMKDLLASYMAFSRGQSPGLEALNFQFKEFLSFITHYRDTYGQEHKRYWKNLYPAVPGELILPGARAAGDRISNERIRGRYFVAFPGRLKARLQSLTKRYDTTLFVLLQATFKSFLFYKTGQPDILIGTNVSGRDYPDTYDQVGSYARTDMIRTVLDEQDSFHDIIRKVVKSNEDLATYRGFTLNSAINALLGRDQGYNSFWKVNMLFDDRSLFHAADGNDRSLSGDLGIDVVPIKDKEGHLAGIDLVLDFLNSNEQLSIDVQYDSSIYNEQTLAGIFGEYLQYTAGLTSDEHLNVKKMPIEPIGMLNLSV